MGFPRRRLGKLIAELAAPWQAARESQLRDRRGHDRQRAPGAGPGHDLVFTDRVIATLVILRFQLPHGAVGLFYGGGRWTSRRAVHESRPLLAQGGFAVPGNSGLRLRTLADVFACAAAEGVPLRSDGTEVPVRRPRANRPGRRAFVSGKKKQNTIKPTVISDGGGRLRGAGPPRPGRMHDVTALRSAGIEDLLRAYPQVRAEADSGYQGLARDFPGQVSAPPKSHPTTPHPSRSPATSNAARPSPPSGSASSTPSPSPGSGGPCSATSAAPNTSKRPCTPSPRWSPTVAPNAEDHQPGTPGQHARTSIAHHVVRLLSCSGWRRVVWPGSIAGRPRPAGPSAAPGHRSPLPRVSRARTFPLSSRSRRQLSGATRARRLRRPRPRRASVSGRPSR